jgi:hypothetical protein
MLKLVSRFVLEVLPAGCAALIVGALLLGHHPLSFGAPGVGARQILAADGPIAPEEIAQRIEDEHAAVTTRNKESAAKPVESRPEPTPVSKRNVRKRPRSFAGLTPPTASAASPIVAPSAPAMPPAADGPALPAASMSGGPEAAADPASKPQPKRVLGMAIPAPVSAIGSKLNPAPVLRAGERMLEKIVVAAKSVVPDFLR